MNLKNGLIAAGLIVALIVSTMFVVQYNTNHCKDIPECVDSIGNVKVDTLVDSLPVDVDTLVFE